MNRETFRLATLTFVAPGDLAETVHHPQAPISQTTRLFQARPQASEADLDEDVAAGTLNSGAGFAGGGELLTTDLTCSEHASVVRRQGLGGTCHEKVASPSAERSEGSSEGRTNVDQNGLIVSERSIERGETLHLADLMLGLEAKVRRTMPLRINPRKRRPSTLSDLPSSKVLEQIRRLADSPWLSLLLPHLVRRDEMLLRKHHPTSMAGQRIPRTGTDRVALLLPPRRRPCQLSAFQLGHLQYHRHQRRRSSHGPPQYRSMPTTITTLDQVLKRDLHHLQMRPPRRRLPL